MLRLRVPVVATAVLGVMCLSGLSGAAWAQTTTGPTVAPPPSMAYPSRTQPLRPQNLNPQGASYSDCINDMVLTFPLIVSNLASSGANLLVFASKSSTCQAQADRGSGGVAVCWNVSASPLIASPINSPTSISMAIRVQDILGPQNLSPSPGTTYTRYGSEACTTQSTFAAVPININFVLLDSGNVMSLGTPYQYVLNTDLVGPPAPQNSNESVGDTLFNITWTPNSDTDTVGYNIFIDQTNSPGSALDAGPMTVTVCPDTGAPVDSAGVGTDSGDDSGNASPEPVGIEASTPSDAGCITFTQTLPPMTSSNGFQCNDPLLQSAITQDAGTTVTTPTTDEAGNVIEGGGTTVTEGAGGLSTIPDSNRVNKNNPTISDKSVGQYTITGLTDGVEYTVVVAAVDAYGNTGPPSAEVCDKPAPVQDFWQTYRNDGGGAGGFCALESVGVGGSSLAGAGAVVAAAAYARRRRRGRR
jgi:hypothetical protein